MLKSLILPHAAELASYLIGIAAAWALGRAALWLKSHRDHVKAGGAADRALGALEVLTRCAAAAVSSVEATLRPTIAEVAADGKLTPAGAAQMKAAAMRAAEEMARTAAPQVLDAAGLDGDLRSLLEHLVEEQAAKLGSSVKPAPAMVPVTSVAGA